MTASVVAPVPMYMRIRRSPRWGIAVALLAIVLLGTHIGCDLPGIALPGPIGVQQASSHSANALCGLSGSIQAFAARWAAPDGGTYRGIAALHGGSALPASVPLPLLTTAATPHFPASDIAPHPLRHLTPRWTQAPPSPI